ncbi:MAG: 30S ribosomal protein S19e [Candidatus Pacearchaeota archaeon]
MEKRKVLDVEANKFVNELSKRLKNIKEFSMPEWAKYVKTSAGNERPPDNLDWWYIRSASILRQLYIKGIIGVERLSKKYKRKKRNKSYPACVFKGSRKIIRTILQQAEKAGFVEKTEKPRKGRQLTKKGKNFLEEVAASIK